MTKRKMPVRTKKIALVEDWEGWNFTARTNFPLYVLRDLSSGDFDKMMNALGGIIVEWNFVDERGDALPSPDAESMGLIPMDLAMAMVNAITDDVSSLDPN